MLTRQHSKQKYNRLSASNRAPSKTKPVTAVACEGGGVAINKGKKLLKNSMGLGLLIVINKPRQKLPLFLLC